MKHPWSRNPMFLREKRKVEVEIARWRGPPQFLPLRERLIENRWKAKKRRHVP